MEINKKEKKEEEKSHVFFRDNSHLFIKVHNVWDTPDIVGLAKPEVAPRTSRKWKFG